MMLLGAAGARIQEEARFEFQSWPEGAAALAGLALLIALIGGSAWLYAREGRAGISMRRRAVLATVRGLVLLLLAVIWLEPVIARYVHRWIDAYTLVLIDTSASMDLVDRYRDADSAARVRAAVGRAASGPAAGQGSGGEADDDVPSVRRSELVQRLLEDGDRAFLKALTERNRVRILTFSDNADVRATLRRVGEAPTPVANAAAAGKQGAESAATLVSDASSIDLALTARGPVTDIARGLRQALDGVGGSPVAGVVVLSDGGFNTGGGVEAAARLLREKRLPVFTVGIGDPSPPRNLRVTQMGAPDTAVATDPFAVSASIMAEGLTGGNVDVILRERGETETGEGRIVARKTISVGTDGVPVRVEFQHQQARLGRYTYSIEAVARPEESVADDNLRSAPVRITDSRTRVLLVAGQPSWEYQNLVRLLQRDPTFELSCWLQSADARAVRDGDVVIHHLPVLTEELFIYDVILLLDPDPAGFDAEWAGRLDRFVSEHGGGLMYVAGRPFSASFMRSSDLRRLIDLLPVTPNPDADLILNRLGHYQRREFVIDVPPEAASHPILRVGADEASTRLAWQGRGGVYWHLPVLRAKPLATVLMRHSDTAMQNQYGPHVLSAVQFVGPGRTGFMAFDSTWRWRQSGPEPFNRFWVQALRFLAQGKLFRGDQRGTILIEGTEFPVGQAVKMTARLLTPQFEPLRVDDVPATATGEETSVEIRLSRRLDQPGEYEGRFVPDRIGTYTLSVFPPGGQAAGALTREIRVVRPEIELIRPQLDRVELQSLAAVSDGGRYFECDQLMQIPALIPDRHEVHTTKGRPTTLWDRWWTLVALVGLLAVEWTVRRWSRLL